MSVAPSNGAISSAPHSNVLEREQNWRYRPRVRPPNQHNSHNKTTAHALETGADNAQGFPPRRPKKNRKKKQKPLPWRISVSEYPAYTRPQDLLDLFSEFGDVEIERFNGFTAVLRFTSSDAVQKSIAAVERLHIYGQFLAVGPFTAKRHDRTLQRKKDYPKSKQKSLILQPTEIDLSGDFDAQMKRILAAIRLTQEEVKRIDAVYRDVENLLQGPWPGCKAIPFGSIPTGLGIKTSDVDCFINLPPQFRTASNHVKTAYSLLIKEPETFTELLAIPRANTPIVKLYHIPSDVNCDLSFKTPLGTRNTRLIAFLMHTDPRIIPLAVLVKYWAKVHELSGTGKLTNYALTMLVVFYLQQLGILPAVEALQSDPADDVLVDIWNTGFMDDPTLLPPVSNKSSVSELLGGFFEFYSNFNFDEMAVCPYLGYPIKKKAFADTANLPERLDRYKHNVLNKLVMPLHHNSPFCIQDPFEQCVNVASIISKLLASNIKQFFLFAVKAYDDEKTNNCLGFFKRILLEKPVIVEKKKFLEYKFSLSPKIMATVSNAKSVVPQLVKTVFENMLKVNLEKVEQSVPSESKKYIIQEYVGNITKPIWRRKKYNLFISSEFGIEERESLITEEILKQETLDFSFQFQLSLSISHNSKSASVAIKKLDGDLGAYRQFGRLFRSDVQRWLTQLLKPHCKLPPVSTNAPAKESKAKE